MKWKMLSWSYFPVSVVHQSCLRNHKVLVKILTLHFALVDSRLSQSILVLKLPIQHASRQQGTKWPIILYISLDQKINTPYVFKKFVTLKQCDFTNKPWNRLTHVCLNEDRVTNNHIWNSPDVFIPSSLWKDGTEG